VDSRAVAPVTGKALEAGVVVLYIALLTTALYGNVVPSYGAAANEQVGDRVLSTAAHHIQQAVPGTDAESVDVSTRVTLPPTIGSAAYRIRADGQMLVLEHPGDDVGGSVRLALPGTVTSVGGTWHSGEPARVEVRHDTGGLTVRLRSDDGGTNR